MNVNDSELAWSILRDAGCSKAASIDAVSRLHCLSARIAAVKEPFSVCAWLCTLSLARPTYARTRTRARVHNTLPHPLPTHTHTHKRFFSVLLSVFLLCLEGRHCTACYLRHPRKRGSKGVAAVGPAVTHEAQALKEQRAADWRAWLHGRALEAEAN